MGLNLEHAVVVIRWRNSEQVHRFMLDCWEHVLDCWEQQSTEMLIGGL